MHSRTFVRITYINDSPRLPVFIHKRDGIPPDTVHIPLKILTVIQIQRDRRGQRTVFVAQLKIFVFVIVEIQTVTVRSQNLGFAFLDLNIFRKERWNFSISQAIIKVADFQNIFLGIIDITLKLG